MKRHTVVNRFEMVSLLVKSALLALGGSAFYWFVINSLNAATKPDEVALSLPGLNLAVTWALFSGWLILRADEEIKKVVDAIHRKDKETFLIEAPKQFAPSLKMLYVLICIAAIVTGWTYHAQSVITIINHFMWAFVVCAVYFVIVDIDEPIGGIVSVDGIPEEWLEELHK